MNAIYTSLLLFAILLNFQIASSAQATIEWENNYGGTGLEYTSAIEYTTDGGYVVVGAAGAGNGDVGGNNGQVDYWVVKIDSIGNLMWEENLGGDWHDYAYGITQTNDGGYMVVGSSNSENDDVSNNYGSKDIWLVKLDADGTLVWGKNYGGIEIKKFCTIVKHESP